MKRTGLLLIKIIIGLVFITVLNMQSTHAQNFNLESIPSQPLPYTLYSQVITPDTSINDMNSFGEDTLMVEEKPKLLPDNISFGEKIFWGESGVFRSVGIAGQLSPEVRRHELSVRRTMLTMHQIGGFLALVSMIGTAWTGQRTIDNPRNKALKSAHQKMIAATITTYSITGLLAILAPPPSIRRDDESTTTIHKLLAWVHVAGMILTPILGSMVSERSKGGPGINIDRAHFHQYAGYLTTAVFAASMIVITF
jgi:hypothetical protein